MGHDKRLWIHLMPNKSETDLIKFEWWLLDARISCAAVSIVFIFSIIIIIISWKLEHYVVRFSSHWWMLKVFLIYNFKNKYSSSRYLYIYENVLLLGGIHYFCEQKREKAWNYKHGFQYVIFRFHFFFLFLMPCF